LGRDNDLTALLVRIAKEESLGADGANVWILKPSCIQLDERPYAWAQYKIIGVTDGDTLNIAKVTKKWLKPGQSALPSEMSHQREQATSNKAAPFGGIKKKVYRRSNPLNRFCSTAFS